MKLKLLKKYQYLYLLEKISHLDSRNDCFDMQLDKRIDFYYRWLFKLNRKYNYESYIIRKYKKDWIYR